MEEVCPVTFKFNTKSIKIPNMSIIELTIVFSDCHRKFTAKCSSICDRSNFKSDVISFDKLNLCLQQAVDEKLYIKHTKSDLDVDIIISSNGDIVDCIQNNTLNMTCALVIQLDSKKEEHVIDFELENTTIDVIGSCNLHDQLHDIRKTITNDIKCNSLFSGIYEFVTEKRLVNIEDEYEEHLERVTKSKQQYTPEDINAYADALFCGRTGIKFVCVDHDEKIKDVKLIINKLRTAKQVMADLLVKPEFMQLRKYKELAYNNIVEVFQDFVIDHNKKSLKQHYDIDYVDFSIPSYHEKKYGRLECITHLQNFFVDVMGITIYMGSCECSYRSRDCKICLHKQKLSGKKMGKVHIVNWIRVAHSLDPEFSPDRYALYDMERYICTSSSAIGIILPYYKT